MSFSLDDFFPNRHHLANASLLLKNRNTSMSTEEMLLQKVRQELDSLKQMNQRLQLAMKENGIDWEVEEGTVAVDNHCSSHQRTSHPLFGHPQLAFLVLGYILGMATVLDDYIGEVLQEQLLTWFRDQAFPTSETVEEAKLISPQNSWDVEVERERWQGRIDYDGIPDPCFDDDDGDAKKARDVPANAGLPPFFLRMKRCWSRDQLVAFRGKLLSGTLSTYNEFAKSRQYSAHMTENDVQGSLSCMVLPDGFDIPCVHMHGLSTLMRMINPRSAAPPSFSTAPLSGNGHLEHGAEMMPTSLQHHVGACALSPPLAESALSVLQMTFQG